MSMFNTLIDKSRFLKQLWKNEDYKDALARVLDKIE